MSQDGGELWPRGAASAAIFRGSEVLLIQRGKEGPLRGLWSFPGGRIEFGEPARDAVLREVREEAGVVARLVEPLGDVRYWYTRNGRRIAKVVSFFLLAYVSGEVEDHDSEVEQARWMALEDAARELSYAGEREMAARALSRTRTA